MNRKTLRDLLAELEDRTAAGTFRWLDSDWRNAFIGAFEHGSVTLTLDYGPTQENDGKTREWVHVSLVNPEGLIADEYSIHESDPEFDSAKQLWRTARATSRGADELLKQMLEEIRRTPAVAA